MLKVKIPNPTHVALNVRHMQLPRAQVQVQGLPLHPTQLVIIPNPSPLRPLSPLSHWRGQRWRPRVGVCSKCAWSKPSVAGFYL